MSDQAPPAATTSDRAPDIAWMVIKVIFYLIRFWVGGMATLAFVGAALEALQTSSGLALWQAFILLIVALVIWPQRYNPLFRYLTARRAKKVHSA